MAEGDETSEEEAPGLSFEVWDDWPEDVVDRYRTLFAFEEEKLVQRDMLGELLAFLDLPPFVERFREWAKDLAEEQWVNLPPSFSDDQYPGQLDQLNTALQEAADFSPEGRPDPTQARNEIMDRIRNLERWFREEVVPRTVTARARKAVATEVAGAPALEDAQALKTLLGELDTRSAAINREIDKRADAVARIRVESGKKAVSELAQVFHDRAEDLGNTAKSWRTALIVASLVALGGTIGAFEILRPEASDSDFTSSDIGRTTLLFLVVGLLVFGVRVCAQGYRSNRHMQAVAQSKEAALSTFVAFSSSINEDEIRAAAALTLAQAVFATDDTGLIDGSSEQITVVERILPSLSGQTRVS